MENWNGLYDRSYFGDSGQKRQEFHAGSQAIMRQQVKELCRMGTMACNAEALAKRRQEFAVRQPYPHRTGPFTQLFFVTQDQSYKPLGERKEGGVIKDFRYAQHLLKQREADFKNQEAAKEDLPPVAPQMLELSPEESQTLELNNLLTQLDDSIELGTLSGFEVGDLKNLLRLLVRLSTIYTEERLVSLLDYFDSLIPSIEKLQDDDNKFAITVLRFVEGMRGFLKDMLKVVTRSPSEKTLAAKASIDKHFKLLPVAERRKLSEVQKLEKEATRATAESEKIRDEEEKRADRVNKAISVVGRVPSDDEIRTQYADTVTLEEVKRRARMLRALYKTVFGSTKPLQKSASGIRNDALRMAREIRDLAREAPAAEESPVAAALAPEQEGEGKPKRFKNERLNRL